MSASIRTLIVGLAGLWAVVSASLAADEPTAAVADASPAARLAASLADREDAALDLVELSTGRRFVRPTLRAVVVKDGKVASLRIAPEGQKQVVTLLLPAIVKIVLDRETIYEAQVEGKAPAQMKAKRAREAYQKRVAESLAAMKNNGVRPWPELSPEQHAAEVEKLEAFVAEVRQVFPKLQVGQTHEFIVATDIPADQMKPYVASLDRMHDMLCDLYGIPKGEPVWKGKCLIFAFLNEEDYLAFEGKFMQVDGRGSHGLCHQQSDGRVITSCFRGDDPAAFAHVIVHETSHGFNHRWMSPQRVPNWLNEGIAEWVAFTVVPNCDQVPLKEGLALEYMRTKGDVGEGFFEARNIASIQYGMASGIVRFLGTKEPRKFAAFVRSIKEGATADDASRQAFGGSIDDLLAAFGRSVGVPGLKR